MIPKYAVNHQPVCTSHALLEKTHQPHRANKRQRIIVFQIKHTTNELELLSGRQCLRHDQTWANVRLRAKAHVSHFFDLWKFGLSRGLCQIYLDSVVNRLKNHKQHMIASFLSAVWPTSGCLTSSFSMSNYVSYMSFLKQQHNYFNMAGDWKHTPRSCDFFGYLQHPTTLTQTRWRTSALAVCFNGKHTEAFCSLCPNAFRFLHKRTSMMQSILDFTSLKTISRWPECVSTGILARFTSEHGFLFCIMARFV